MNFSQQMIALKTITIKEFLRFIRIWIQTVLPPAITIALYFIIFGEIIGSQIQDINGYKYMDYIVFLQCQVPPQCRRDAGITLA
jgi:ABC-2 type transport system permease protein